MIEKTETELLPCPFCGGRARLIEPMLDLLPYVECIRCSVKKTMSINNDEAIADWNRRSPTPDAELVEALKPCVGWLQYAYWNVSSVTSAKVKEHLPTMRALIAKHSPLVTEKGE